MKTSPIIDDLTQPAPQACTGTDWEYVADGIMGGLSRGTLRRTVVAGRIALHLTGRVSLANNGGFVQAALDLAPGGHSVDARGWQGIALDVCGNAEVYNLHLRTADVLRPWQSYRASFVAPANWTTVSLPFSAFVPHRVVAPLNLATLRRIGLVAIGRAFQADLAVAVLRFI